MPRCVKETKYSQTEGENQSNSLSKEMDFMTIKFEENGQERQEKNKIIDSMKSDMVNMD